LINAPKAHESVQSYDGLSRRARRELERDRSRPKILRPFARLARKIGSPATAVSRLALVGALAGITIVIPVRGDILPESTTFSFAASAQAETATDLVTEIQGPTSLDVLTSDTEVTGGIELTEEDIRSRELVVASRMAEREELPGCDPSGPFPGSNGNLPDSSLCAVWDGTKFRSDAALALTDLNQDFRAQFGRDICITSGYRTFARQQSLKREKGYLAATPGRSQHGWGLAADLCSSESRAGTTEWNWLEQNAPVYGWDNPAWARRGGSGAFEPWHWEFSAE